MKSFFEREADAPCKRGRILLVSYHFPPAQTAGALRWRKLADFAHERGWGIDVLTRDPAELTLKDDESLASLPPGVRVFGIPDPPIAIDQIENRLFDAYRWLRSLQTRALRPETSKPPESESDRSPGVAAQRPVSLAREEQFFRLTEPRTWIRAYWAAISFARERKWALRATAGGRQIFDPNSHRVVASSGPPHMAHEAARRLSVEFNLPMVVDMRDAWSLSERTPEPLASPLLFLLARHYERPAIERANLISMNTDPARTAMQRAYPELAERVEAIPNAYDDRPVPKIERGARFLIAYAGTIYLDRTPRTLFKAAGLLVRELNLEPKNFALEFMGHIDSANGESIEEMAQREGLSEFVCTHPPAEYATAERFMAGAAVLVSLSQDSHLAIPSKIFDYMRFEARLLVLAEPESATAQHLADSDAHVIAPEEVAQLVDFLRSAYQEHLAGARVLPVGHDPRFSRRRAADQLFDAIDRILTPSESV